jgi:hypothetical protein
VALKVSRELIERNKIYDETRERAEKFLIPFYKAKKSGWKAMDVANVLLSVLDAAETNKWYEGYPASYSFEKKNNGPGPFHDKERVSKSILQYILVLCPDLWKGETECDFNSLSKIQLGNWGSPKNFFHQQLPPGNALEKKGILRSQKAAVSFEEQIRLLNYSRDLTKINRVYWRRLARKVDYLRSESEMTVFEYQPYALPIFRFNKALFRDQLFYSFRGAIDHQKFCENVLAPIYFEAIFSLKTIYQSRVKKLSGSKEKAGALGSRQSTQKRVHDPFDSCIECELILPSASSRSDKKFCDDICRNEYHRRNKKA